MAVPMEVRILGHWGDTLIAVRPANGAGQDILIEPTELGRVLARLLAQMDGGGDPREEDLDHDLSAVLPGGRVLAVSHSQDLDDRLKRLIDLLIDLRYAHPRLVQLALHLNAED